jgi:hypothetical protein
MNYAIVVYGFHQIPLHGPTLHWGKLDQSVEAINSVFQFHLRMGFACSQRTTYMPRWNEVSFCP